MGLSFLGKGGRGGSFDDGGDPWFAMLTEVRAYWEGLRLDTALPMRDQIDPRGIAGALENTFLLERVAPGVARFRLAGMQLHDLMGMDVRGMPLSALIEPAGRARLAAASEMVFSDPSVLEIWLEGERGIGRPALEGRLLVLPLRNARGQTDLALGCLALNGALGRAPRRFAIAGVVNEQIARRDEDRRQIPRAALDRHEPVPGLAEVTASYIPAIPRPPRAKPNLRLVHSRD